MFLNWVAGKGRERGLKSKLCSREISSVETSFQRDFSESCAGASEVLGLLSTQLLRGVKVDRWMCRLIRWTKSRGCKRERYCLMSQDLWKNSGWELLASCLVALPEWYYWPGAAWQTELPLKSWGWVTALWNWTLKGVFSQNQKNKANGKPVWRCHLLYLIYILLNQQKLDFQVENGSEPWKMTIAATRRNT